MRHSIAEQDFVESSLMDELRDYAATVPVELVDETSIIAAVTVQAMLGIDGNLMDDNNSKVEPAHQPKGWGASADELDAGINMSEIDLSGDLFKKYFS